MDLSASYIKRGRGRPRGSKNKPGAGHVGRPRNDGQPPRKRQNGHDAVESATPDADHSALQTPVGDRCRDEDESTSTQTGVSAASSPAHQGRSIARNAPLKQAMLRFRRDSDTQAPTTRLSVPGPASSVPPAGNGVCNDVSAATLAQEQQPPATSHQLPILHQDLSSLPSSPNPSNTLLESGGVAAIAATRSTVPPAESPATSGVPQQQLWRHSANMPVRPPSPTVEPQNESNFPDVPENPYGSDLGVPACEGDQGEEESLEDEFRPVADDGGEEEDEHGKRTSSTTSGPSRSTMPLWLDAQYKAVEETLKKEIKQSTRSPPMPKCYEQQRLWVGDASPFLTLLTQQNSAVEPSIFHRPTFFVWLPHCLLGDRIPCPQCKSTNRVTDQGKPVFLQRLGWIGKPRRVVDVDRNIYIIGYRYACVNLTCRKTYRSWSPAILGVLPTAVAMQFPFQLTYRSGLSNSLVSLLHSSIRAGIGPVPFAQMLQSFHYRRFDELHLQYLELVHDRYKSCPKQFWVRKRAFGLFSDRSGYAGFVPSAGYLCRFYDMLIEQWSPEMKQFIAMLPARVLAIDHSFKIIKRLGRVGNSPLFTALHTVVNEYSEIRSMLFTMTKGHDQYMPNLHEICASLKKFGHPEVQAVFTDNVRADRLELQRAFPSLLKDVIPVPPHSTLPPLEFPQQIWRITELSSTHQVNHRFDIIMNHRTTANPHVTVAFDMEWPVNLQTGIYGRVALIQVAYQNTVYLIKTAPFVENGFIKLPHSLLVFLRSPLFKKVGVNIGADFKRLQNDCGMDTRQSEPFVGQVELGGMAKERGAAVKKTAGLAELVATFLHRHLLKDPQVRISPRWADPVLPPEYTSYAVLDVYSVSLVYQQLAGMDIARPVRADTPGGTEIALLAPDGQEVAHGIVALERPPAVDGIDVTPKRVVMTVSNVLVPSFLVPARMHGRTKQAKSLASFGSTPFLIVADVCNLRICLSNHDSGSNGETSSICSMSSHPGIEISQIANHEESAAFGLDPGYIDSSSPLDLNEDNDDDIDDISPEQTIEGSSRDPSAEVALARVMEPYMNFTPTTNTTVRSRVLYDNFHCYNQFPIARHHGLRRPFSRALSAAFFIPVTEDKAAVEAVLKDFGTTYNAQLLSKPEWVLSRVRRHVPPPEILLPRVAEVIKTYGPLKDATTGQPLFSDRAWDIAKNIMENVRLGYYSDPADVDLYYETGKDRHGLIFVEGGVHQNLIRRYTSFNTSPRHAINVGQMNRTGKPYIGHFNVPLKNRVSRLLTLTADAIIPGGSDFVHGWVNGNDYELAQETFGMIQFSPTFFRPLGMLDFNEVFAREQKICHKFIAESQGTLVAILPVHTCEERDLFQLLIHSSPLFADSTIRQPNWTALAVVWAGHADGRHIFYKACLPEHLKAYYKTWTDFCNEQNTISLNAEASQRIRALVRSSPPNVHINAPTTLPTTLRDSLAVSPSVDITEVNSWQIGKLLADHALQQSAVLYLYGDGTAANPSSTGQPPSAPTGHESAATVKALNARGGGP
ncbi:hypothetical protein M405DRAFT_876164 [Rhizopogon salebrosus TDB-379]|nr:hypothetical protein M405DRAFT_876164 [Rhizopogon salebrosus TDB-379]